MGAYRNNRDHWRVRGVTDVDAFVGEWATSAQKRADDGFDWGGWGDVVEVYGRGQLAYESLYINVRTSAGFYNRIGHGPKPVGAIGRPCGLPAPGET